MSHPTNPENAESMAAVAGGQFPQPALADPAGLPVNRKTLVLNYVLFLSLGVVLAGMTATVSVTGKLLMAVLLALPFLISYGVRTMFKRGRPRMPLVSAAVSLLGLGLGWVYFVLTNSPAMLRLGWFPALAVLIASGVMLGVQRMRG